MCLLLWKKRQQKRTKKEKGSHYVCEGFSASEAAKNREIKRLKLLNWQRPHIHIHTHLLSIDCLPLCESNEGRLHRRGLVPCLVAHAQPYWTAFVHMQSIRTRTHIQAHTTAYCMGKRWNTIREYRQGHRRTHIRLWALWTWFQVSPSVSLSFSVLPSHANVDISIWFTHKGIISFGVMQIQSHNRVVIETGKLSMSHLVKGVQTPSVNECTVVDLPSFDIVQEGEFNVHQEWQQRYLKKDQAKISNRNFQLLPLQLQIQLHSDSSTVLLYSSTTVLLYYSTVE